MVFTLNLYQFMGKNFYDILEVSRFASSEVIEKAYKTLAKKYHPDLQPEELKKDAENNMKKLNEAYEVLSNENKRKDYDLHLKQIELEKEQARQRTDDYNKNSDAQNHNYTNNVNNSSNIYNNHNNYNVSQDSNNTTNSINKEEIYNKVAQEYKNEYTRKMNDAINKAYYDAYIQDLKNRGYRIIYKKSFKDYVRICISFVLTILVLFLIYQIPPVKKYFLDFYQDFIQNNELVIFIRKILR